MRAVEVAVSLLVDIALGLVRCSVQQLLISFAPGFCKMYQQP